MKYLFIAEKNSLMKEIQSVYSKEKGFLSYDADFDCFAGHIIRRAEPKEYNKTHPNWAGKWEEISLPIIPEKFSLLVADSKIYSRLTKKIKENKYDAIVNACDPDREGMAIFELFRSKAGINLPIKRFWTNDLTEKAIGQALLNLRDSTKDNTLIQLKDAAILRGDFDWLVGMNFTIAYSLKMKGTAKLGRVKTPTLALIVNREKEIANFTPKKTYEIESTFREGFKGSFIDSDGVAKLATLAEAQEIIKQLGTTAIVTSIETKEEKKPAPALFKLSKLQTEAGKAFGYNADTILACCQYLYEQKVTSYPRTDCEFISTELTKEFVKMLRAVASFPELEAFVNRITQDDMDKTSRNSRYVNDKKLAESGHSALVPTGFPINFESLETNLSTFNKEHKTNLQFDQVKNVLLFIFKRFLCIFMADYRLEVKNVLLVNNNHNFKATDKKVLSLGFMELFSPKEKESLIPSIKKESVLNVLATAAVEKITTPPTRFTDGALIAAMESPSKFLTNQNLKDIMNEKNGIGTPATRAEIIKELLRNGYIERQKGKGKGEFLVPSNIGMSLITNLEGEDIISVDMTGEWESKLKQVELGTLKASDFRKEMEHYVSSSIQKINNNTLNKIVQNEEAIGKCPNCGGEIMVGKTSYYCSNYKQGCKYGFGKDVIKGITQKSLSSKEALEIIKSGKLLNQIGCSKKGNSTYVCYFLVSSTPDGKVKFDLRFPDKKH